MTTCVCFITATGVTCLGGALLAPKSRAFMNDSAWLMARDSRKPPVCPMCNKDYGGAQANLIEENPTLVLPASDDTDSSLCSA